MVLLVSANWIRDTFSTYRHNLSIVEFGLTMPPTVLYRKTYTNINIINFVIPVVKFSTEDCTEKIRFLENSSLEDCTKKIRFLENSSLEDCTEKIRFLENSSLEHFSSENFLPEHYFLGLFTAAKFIS
jgi:hypothetical protein